MGTLTGAVDYKSRSAGVLLKPSKGLLSYENQYFELFLSPFLKTLGGLEMRKIPNSKNLIQLLEKQDNKGKQWLEYKKTEQDLLPGFLNY